MADKPIGWSLRPLLFKVGTIHVSVETETDVTIPFLWSGRKTEFFEKKWSRGRYHLVIVSKSKRNGRIIPFDRLNVEQWVISVKRRQQRLKSRLVGDLGHGG
jgi:hypothetical protein